jgi:hypothetical protein
MLVRFTKGTPGAAPDTITCVRPNGTSATAPMPRQAILPHLAFHFVAESTLAWRDALFGRIAAGGALDATSSEGHGMDGLRSRNTQALQCEALIECLEAAQWGGAPDPAEFAQSLLRACRRRAVSPPDITAEELERVRLALREFGAAWRPLTPGQSLERIF